MELIGRVHRIKRPGRKLLFLIVRDNENTCQVVCTENEFMSVEMLNEIYAIPLESVVRILGTKTLATVKSCTISCFEIQATNVEVLSRAAEKLPLQVTNEIQSDQETRLNHRCLDLRIFENKKIFKVQSLICKYFRKYFDCLEFIEVHTPKLISTASESGADVFQVLYFSNKAYLAQSPQFYKQMAINSDFEKVYEIGPVFRAEKSLTYRHLTEFTGLDIEMIITDYQELITILWNFMVYLLEKLSNYHNLTFSKEPLLFTYGAVLEKLKVSKLGTAEEKQFGKIVKDEYNVDLFMITEFPESERPFYTKSENGITFSYDIILRGNEILSGSERENSYTILQAKAQKMGITNIEHYLESFKYGSYRHGGGGFGLERLTMFILGLDNIRKTSLFPRDPNRIVP